MKQLIKSENVVHVTASRKDLNCECSDDFVNMFTIKIVAKL